MVEWINSIQNSVNARVRKKNEKKNFNKFHKKQRILIDAHTVEPTIVQDAYTICNPIVYSTLMYRIEMYSFKLVL